MKVLSKIYTGLILLFLFAPIAIMIVFSFNGQQSTAVMSGFSFRWYEALADNARLLESLRNTLILAFSAAIVSTIMGTAAAVGIFRLRKKYLRVALDTVTNIPMINPDIITGISLMLMFVFVGRLFGLANKLSFWTMLIAHITFCLPYVILQVLPKLQQMDKSQGGAARADARHPHRHDHGLHPFAGRFCHQLLYHGRRFPDAAHFHLQHDKAGRKAHRVCAGYGHLLCHSGAADALQSL